MNGIELEDREFFAAIKEKRQPKSSLDLVLGAYQTMERLEKQIGRVIAA
jgi:2-hydroxy-4-carboxymuconate semialdehyde hemiacetal dehydrogenase